MGELSIPELLLTSLELEESWAMAPMARAEREATMMETRMLVVLIWVIGIVLGGNEKSRRAKRASAGY